MAKLTVRGLVDLKRSLRRLAAESEAIAAPAIKSGLEVLASAMAGEAPSDTGTLEGGIRVVPHPTRNGRVSAEATTTEADYAAHVDLGTVDMEANDFVQRAFDERKDRAADVAIEAINKGINRVMS